jgi:hypothetical protein
MQNRLPRVERRRMAHKSQRAFVVRATMPQPSASLRCISRFPLEFGPLTMLYTILGVRRPEPAGYEKGQRGKESRDPGVPGSALQLSLEPDAPHQPVEKGDWLRTHRRSPVKTMVVRCLSPFSTGCYGSSTSLGASPHPPHGKRIPATARCRAPVGAASRRLPRPHVPDRRITQFLPAWSHQQRTEKWQGANAVERRSSSEDSPSEPPASQEHRPANLSDTAPVRRATPALWQTQGLAPATIPLQFPPRVTKTRNCPISRVAQNAAVPVHAVDALTVQTHRSSSRNRRKGVGTMETIQDPKPDHRCSICSPQMNTDQHR